VTRTGRLLIGFALLAATPARAADLFLLDQRYATIAFSVTHFGSFTSIGNFPRFVGRLLIDRLHPEHSKIEVRADATQVTVPWQDGTDMLRSADFFDIARFPEVRFTSTSVRGVDPTHFAVDGVLEMRGVSRPLELTATLEREQTNQAAGKDIGDFRVTGTLSRAAYGMTTQNVMISDQVRITIDARIELPAETH
jgi:polyisoprenoid-binding protein YceI